MNMIRSSSHISTKGGFIHFILIVLIILVLIFVFHVDIGHIWDTYIKPPIIAFISWFKSFVTGDYLDGLRTQLDEQNGNIPAE